jgi:hypothetical protein
VTLRLLLGYGCPVKAPDKLGLVLLAVLVPGCDRETKPDADATTQPAPGKGETATPPSAAPVMPTPLTLDREPPTLTTIDDAARARAQDLAASFQGHFSYEVGNRHNALALLHLARTATDVKLVKEALEAMAHSYGPKQTEEDRAFEADYFAVVRYRLASDEPPIEEAAFKAAREGMAAEPADPALLALLVDRAYYHPKPEGRVLALVALDKMRSPTKEVENAFHHALHDESTALVTLTLTVLGYSIGGMLPDQARLEQRLLELVVHADPGVRGMAAVVIADRAPYDERERTRLAGLIAPLGADPHWFVRLCALAARVDLDDPSVLPALVAMLDDQTKNELRVEDWVDLDGSSKSEVVYSGIYGDTLSIAAVRLLADATKGQPHAFDPTPPDFHDMPSSHRRALAEAKAWAEQNAALLRPPG